MITATRSHMREGKQKLVSVGDEPVVELPLLDALFHFAIKRGGKADSENFDLKLLVRTRIEIPNEFGYLEAWTYEGPENIMRHIRAFSLLRQQGVPTKEALCEECEEIKNNSELDEVSDNDFAIIKKVPLEELLRLVQVCSDSEIPFKNILATL